MGGKLPPSSSLPTSSYTQSSIHLQYSNFRARSKVLFITTMFSHKQVRPKKKETLQNSERGRLVF